MGNNIHNVEIKVRYSETDKMGIVYHANYFIWFEIGRTELLRNYGIPYSLWEERGYFLPVVEANCRYIKPAKYDDIIKIQTELEKIEKSLIVLGYKLFNNDGLLLAKGFTQHICIDKNGKVKPIPDDFLNTLKELLKKE